MRQFFAQSVKPLLGNLHPFLAALLVWMATFGATMAIRIFIEGHLYWLRLTAFWVGDAIGFPIFGFFAALALAKYVPSGKWFDRLWWRFVLCLLCWGVSAFNTLNAMASRDMTVEEFLTPSEVYHAVMMGPVGALILSSLVPLARANAPRRYKLLAVAGLAIWVIAVMFDAIFLSAKPGR